MKIIQIAVCSKSDRRFDDNVYALTDTGEVYAIALGSFEPEWLKLPGLPEPK